MRGVGEGSVDMAGEWRFGLGFSFTGEATDRQQQQLQEGKDNNQSVVKVTGQMSAPH